MSALAPTLANGLFSTSGCWIEIDGCRFDVSTKFGLLTSGVCNVAPARPADETAADDLMDMRVGGEDWEAWGCADARLVELAMRYADWLNDKAHSPWRDTPATPLAEEDALKSAMAWLQAHITPEGR